MSTFNSSQALKVVISERSQAQMAQDIASKLLKSSQPHLWKSSDKRQLWKTDSVLRHQIWEPELVAAAAPLLSMLLLL